MASCMALPVSEEMIFLQFSGRHVLMPSRSCIINACALRHVCACGMRALACISCVDTRLDIVDDGREMFHSTYNTYDMRWDGMRYRPSSVEMMFGMHVVNYQCRRKSLCLCSANEFFFYYIDFMVAAIFARHLQHINTSNISIACVRERTLLYQGIC